jgi:hypothetical protein
MYTNGVTDGLYVYMDVAVVSVDVILRYRETAFGLVYAENETLPVSSVFAAFFESLKRP